MLILPVRKCRTAVGDGRADKASSQSPPLRVAALLTHLNPARGAVCHKGSHAKSTWSERFVI